jgi:hypothetical protein
MPDFVQETLFAREFPVYVLEWKLWADYSREYLEIRPGSPDANQAVAAVSDWATALIVLRHDLARGAKLFVKGGGGVGSSSPTEPRS